MVDCGESGLGTIVNCNSNLIEHLGYDPAQLRGVDLSTLLPFFASDHQQHILRYVSQASKSFHGESQWLFLVTKDRFCFPVSIQFVDYYDHSSQRMVLYTHIQPIKTEAAIVFDSRGDILYFTDNLFNSFELLRMSTTHRFNVLSVISRLGEFFVAGQVPTFPSTTIKAFMMSYFRIDAINSFRFGKNIDSKNYLRSISNMRQNINLIQKNKQSKGLNYLFYLVYKIECRVRVHEIRSGEARYFVADLSDMQQWQPQVNKQHEPVLEKVYKTVRLI